MLFWDVSRKESKYYVFVALLRIRDVLSRIPDPDLTLLHPRFDPGSWIRGVKKHRIPDPGSALFFLHRLLSNFVYLSWIPDPDPTIAPSRIPDLDPGSRGKKAPDPVSRIRNTGSLCTLLLGSCLLWICVWYDVMWIKLFNTVLGSMVGSFF
jgi:hypothetical protein